MSQVSDYTNYQNSTQRMQDSFDTERAETRANQEKELKRKEEEAEENIAKTKHEYSERMESERAQARDEIKRLKEEVYNQSGKNTAKDAKSEQVLKNEYAHYRDDVKKDADRKVSMTEDRMTQSSVHQNDITEDKITAALAAQKQSQFQEVRNLEDELAQYQNSDRDVAAERAKARADSVTENERGNIDEKNRIIQGYERQIASMKRHEDELARHYDRQLSESMFDSNETAQRQVKNQKQEFTKIFRDDLADKNRLEKTYKAEAEALKTRQSRSADNLIDQTMADRELVARDKDQTYQKYIAEKNKRFTHDVDQRDEKIKELQTTDDPLKVSPFIIQKINDAAAKRNHDQLLEAQSVHEKNLSAEKTRDQSDRSAMAQDFKTNLTNLHRDSRREIDVESRQMRDAYNDLAQLHETGIANVNEQKRQLADRLYQKSSAAMVEAQREKQEALNDQKDNLVYDKNVQMDEANQNIRNQDREWFMKMNDLRRNFEAKLNIERDDHDKLSHEMRLEFDKKLRDQDRVSKREVDDRVRSYEHLMVQQELAFKEKERFLTEHYEEELDRMKRTNAHLIQKKS